MRKAFVLLLTTAAVQAIVPHMQAVAARLEELTREGTIWASDSNVICDGLLAAAACDPSVHPQVLPVPPYEVPALWGHNFSRCRNIHITCFISRAHAEG